MGIGLAGNDHFAPSSFTLGGRDQNRSWTHLRLSAFIPDGGGLKYVPVEVEPEETLAWRG